MSHDTDTEEFHVEVLKSPHADPEVARMRALLLMRRQASMVAAEMTALKGLGEEVRTSIMLAEILKNRMGACDE